jgi:hypothetical protein
MPKGWRYRWGWHLERMMVWRGGGGWGGVGWGGLGWVGVGWGGARDGGGGGVERGILTQ